jgi:hypothetical protein
MISAGRIVFHMVINIVTMLSVLGLLFGSTFCSRVPCMRTPKGSVRVHGGA